MDEFWLWCGEGIEQQMELVQTTLICEFRMQTNAYKNSYEFKGQIEMPEAPLVGDTISIDGHPYNVISRGWAVSTERTDGKVYCYVTVLDSSPKDS